MQSIIQKKLYNSVCVFWLNKDLLRRRVLACVRSLVSKESDVKKVILFGSVAEEREVVSSDVDILLVVDESKERFIDRPIRFKQYFENLGLGVDIFVYTRGEIKTDIPLVNTAMRRGKVLFEAKFCTD